MFSMFEFKETGFDVRICTRYHVCYETALLKKRTTILSVLMVKIGFLLVLMQILIFSVVACYQANGYRYNVQSYWTKNENTLYLYLFNGS